MPRLVLTTQTQGWLDVQPSRLDRALHRQHLQAKLFHHTKSGVSMRISWFLLLFTELKGQSSLSIFMEMFPHSQRIKTVNITSTHRNQSCNNQVSFLDPWVVGSFLSLLLPFIYFLSFSLDIFVLL